MGIYQPTLQCNFRCPYCDDGTGTIYPHRDDIKAGDLDLTKKALKEFKKVCPALAVSGGEATLRNDIVEIMRYAAEVGFNPISLNTNAFLLDRYMEVLKYVDFLIVSLDTFNSDRKQKMSGLKKSSQTDRVFENITAAEKYRADNKLDFDIIVNTLVLPETIADAWEVFDYCVKNNFYWSPMPHVSVVYPNSGLVDNPLWLELMDEVIRAKKSGARIFGSLKGLEIVRNFSRFECYPVSRITMTPEGDIYYPCAPLNVKAGNILESTYKNIIKEGERQAGVIPRCDTRCHISCYLEGSLMISHPLSAIREAVSLFKSRSKSFTLKRPDKVIKYGEIPETADFQNMLSMSPEKVRNVRAQNLIENDFTSYSRLK